MIRLIAPLMLTVVSLAPSTTLADASTGEFMGYQLGKTYEVTANTKTSPSPAGNLHVIAEQPTMPADMAAVRLTVTAASHTIGYIDAYQDFESEHLARQFAKKYYQLLRAKYPAWQIDTNEIELSNELQPVALNMNLSPHTIRMKIVEGTGARPYRTSITLSFLYDGPNWRTWSELARAERDDQQKSTDERLLEETDTRGL